MKSTVRIFESSEDISIFLETAKLKSKHLVHFEILPTLIYIADLKIFVSLWKIYNFQYYSVTNLQDFVADYIQYRIRIHNNHKTPKFMHPYRQQSENDLIRSVALIFEEKHEEELQKIMEILCKNKNYFLSRYVEVSNETSTHFVK